MTDSFRRLALLALAIIAWALADQIGGNGFIAAFVGGLLIGPTVKRLGERVIRFTEAEGQLLNLSVFFIFGVLVLGAIQPLSWEVVLYALLSLTLIRMLPVALSLYGTHLRSVSVLFAGWFGPRGLASIVLGLIVVEEAPLLPGRGRDRGGGSADGAAQCAAARGYRCPALGCVRPPCSGDGSGRAREARNGRGADPRGLCAARYSERWVRPEEISRWK